MKRTAAGVAALLAALALHQPRNADACGVKLTIKAQGPRKSATMNHSQVLVINGSDKLRKELSSSGMSVDSASSVSGAKKTRYTAVVVDSQHAAEARAQFPNSTVIVATGDAVADARSVNNEVSKRPLRTDQGRVAIAARTGDRKPIAAGPIDRPEERRIVATKDPTATTSPTPPAPTPPAPTPPAPTPPTPTPTPPPQPAVTTTVAPPVETPAEKPAKPEKKVAVAASVFHDEVHFTHGGFALSGATTSQLAQSAKWLADNPTVNVTIEGHADPTGTPEANMELSQKRAEAVRDYLVGKGLDGSRFEISALGDTQLKYGKADGRNRRVMLTRKQ